MANRNKNSDASFLMQGSILAIASIISRIVGFIYRIPLTDILGDKGNNYYSTAYEIYNILLIISSYSIPLAVSKLVSARMAKGQAKDAKRVLQSALLFAFTSGLIATLVLYIGSEFFCGSMLKTPLAAIAVKVLAPTIFIFAILSVLRGFFNGLGTMIPTAVSQVLEQIVNAVVSVVAAGILFKYGKKVGGVLGHPQKYAAAFGAAGGTLGTLLGAVFALIFMCFVFFAFKNVFAKMLARDKHKRSEGYYDILVSLLLTIFPVLLSTTVYNINAIIDNGIYKNLAMLQGYKENFIEISWGIFGGKYKVLINVPIAIASSMAASAVPSLTAAIHSGDNALVRRRINMANRFIMVIAFPCAVGLSVLASPILISLWGDTREMSARMLMLGGCTVIFTSLSTLSNGVLQGINQMMIPVKNALLSLVAHVAVLFLLMEVFHLHIYAVIISQAFYSLMMCFLNQSAVARFSGSYINVRKVIIAPLEASAVMGLVVYLIYKMFNAIFALGISSVRMTNLLSCVIAIVIGVVVYFISLFVFKGIDEETLLKFPGGNKLCNIAYGLHLLR